MAVFVSCGIPWPERSPYVFPSPQMDYSNLGAVKRVNQYYCPMHSIYHLNVGRVVAVYSIDNVSEYGEKYISEMVVQRVRK